MSPTSAAFARIANSFAEISWISIPRSLNRWRTSSSSGAIGSAIEIWRRSLESLRLGHRHGVVAQYVIAAEQNRRADQIAAERPAKVGDRGHVAGEQALRVFGIGVKQPPHAKIRDEEEENRAGNRQRSDRDDPRPKARVVAHDA